MKILRIIIFILTLFKVCIGTATLSITLSKYNNSEGRLSDGSWCDYASKCDHAFEVCVGQFECYTTTSVSQNTIDFFRTPITQNPKVFTLNKWQGDILLKVKVWDDNTFSNDLVDELETEIRMNASRSRSEGPAKSFTLKRRTELTVQVGVFCDYNWYGPRCDCHPMSNDTGHYHCATNGSKICSPTYYYGPDCNIECHSSFGPKSYYNCSSNGSKICHQNWYRSHCTRYCKPSNINRDGHYNCTTYGTKTCHPGWTGENCTVDIDECQSNPCQNSGECEDKINGFICKCKDGYTGLHCETLLQKEHSTASTTASNNEGKSATTTTPLSETSRSNAKVLPIALGVVAIILLVYSGVLTAVHCRKQLCAKKRRNDINELEGDDNAYTYIPHSAVYAARAMARNRQDADQGVTTHADMVSDVDVRMLEGTRHHAATNLDEEHDGYLAPNRGNIQEKEQPAAIKTSHKSTDKERTEPGEEEMPDYLEVLPMVDITGAGYKSERNVERGGACNYMEESLSNACHINTEPQPKKKEDDRKDDCDEYEDVAGATSVANSMNEGNSDFQAYVDMAGNPSENTYLGLSNENREQPRSNVPNVYEAMSKKTYSK